MSYEFPVFLGIVLFFSVSIGKQLAEKMGIDMGYHAILTFILCIVAIVIFAHQ